MKLLLDTHTFLWFVGDAPQLSVESKHLLESEVDLLLSIVSVWEMAIKVSIGKLAIPKDFMLFLPQQLMLNEIEILPIHLAHIHAVVDLPFYHRDPFDPLLAAQSLTEQIPLVSADVLFDRYGVNRVW